MRIMLRQTWRPPPFTSFMGVMDLKTGVGLALLFALFNKVAGVYGLIAVFTGGTIAQVSLYIYSIATLALFLWGLKAVNEEDARNVFYIAHLFICDHLFSTLWLGYFSVLWWVYTAHDGRPTPHSAAQLELIKGADGGRNITEAERTEMAMALWNREKHFAAFLLAAGWLIKIYFAALLYSYAVHLRRGTYRTLPLSKPLLNAYDRLTPSATRNTFDFQGEGDEFEADDAVFEARHNRVPSNGAYSKSRSQRRREDLIESSGEVIFDDSETLVNGDIPAPRRVS
ncbi:DUF1753-domain-containing protein [Sistotremastrum niveocremeum HHB9708]|uniref:DUF1753-domain-containing protein n=1 Tax=Sistotremastrum niveocremeum HHB9708 TaxID=1314777 RepID=A0A164VYJ3_9AGAM|nr:DUF1753-domain-containing protein [Sistotremastrum niveocremeum HHB9708]